MSTSTKRPSRFVVALKLPEEQTPLLLVQARAIVERMTGNSWFPSPVPSLTVVQAAIDELSQAETSTLTRAKGTATARDEKRLVLVMRLQQLGYYVEAIANANPEHGASIVESASMHLKTLAGPAPRVFTAKPTGIAGELKVFAPKAGSRAAYEFAFSLDGGVTWTSPPPTTEANTMIRGLTPGSTVHLRVRATVKAITGDWSDVIAEIVT